ncbi:ABC transporter ATP-binding protein [Methanoplanus sp. FWC-SCC4]|uniref:ABC transporter ATP-binding protein n=1 Tax=Methanochimaera problematica TaxID=2609417 RepID=A0AA97FH54_9EURY|nr:ABC transporter ATP-binding protein [Methanoplanus sp. FWC-SCC4]WOF17346.1 ABC transporter ATP-binding protein [Methanoplanus sp. FWC-SCC4]
MITLKDVFKIYGIGAATVHALNGVSLEIEKGEFVGITGSSGSGKSTLLHMVGLLDEPTKGDVFIGTTDVLELSDEEKSRFRLKRFGYVFQDYALVPELSAAENVLLLAMARGLDDEEAKIKSVEILEKVGLSGRIEHLPGEMSGGEQQRVAIARALVNNPEILFADEPCANLDSVNSKNVLDLFREINRELKQTIVMVSHEDWHIPYFDRIIRLHDGKIIEDYKPKK